MISRIEIENFKSLQKVDLQLGNLNLFVGTNASGKSNFFDALRVLQGIGYGFTIDEILNGKAKSASSDVWEGIRGGSARALFTGRQPAGRGGDGIVSFSAHITHGKREYRYSIGLSPQRGTVRSESLVTDQHVVYQTAFGDWPETQLTMPVSFPDANGTGETIVDFERSRPILHQILGWDAPESRRDDIQACITALSNAQRIDPSPAVLRDYSKAQAVKRLGERGENFAALVKAILANEQEHAAYVSWLRQLTPVEVDDVTVLSGALGEPLFAIREGGIDQPAPILSDGTLRFAAITAAFFQPDMPDILTIEEIENGIHPSRLRLLVELLRSQSKSGGRQIMATTHSPIVLAWLKPEDYQYTFFCKRDEESGASVISPLSAVPRFMAIVDKQPIGDLFAEGWLEGAL